MGKMVNVCPVVLWCRIRLIDPCYGRTKPRSTDPKRGAELPSKEQGFRG
jgi:hypothetical protein